MNIRIIENETSKIAVIESSDILINGTQDALDLMATINHVYECNKMILS